MALMDYIGTPESADPVVEILLFDPKWLEKNQELALAWPLLKYESKKWASRQEQYDYMVNNRNSEFSCSSTFVNVQETQRIQLRLIKL